ncbi:selenocysteine lyase-like isoform X2 [Oscarella lobularis]|uniref:selenocysteine lyase-like isoform X2 n=1 Tax=Oscarella lobularis TaxID=121494 RepID=UPI0033136B04
MSRERKVYLDCNATTPLAEDVLRAIYSALADCWANPSSSHNEGKKAKVVIDNARHWVSKMINSTERDVIFTSGGTESNNLAIHSAVEYYSSSRDFGRLPHVVTTNLEHDSVALCVQALKQKGCIDLSVVLASHEDGTVHAEDIVAELRPNTVLVSVMMANNETGIIQPVSEIASAVKKWSTQQKTRILIHTDAAQAIGKIPVDVEDLGVDYLTIAGHKFYGPRTGALYARNPGVDTPIHAMLYGGGQERNFRPGTENTGMIAGLGKAAELVCKNLDEYSRKMVNSRDYLESNLEEAFEGSVQFNGRFLTSRRLPNTCNVSFVDSRLGGSQILASLQHTLASNGSACHEGASSYWSSRSHCTASA